MEVARVRLRSTSGAMVDVREASEGLACFFVYPRTGRPDEPAPQGWDEIPGARGCTPHSCGYRDLWSEFGALGARVYGLSSVGPAHQAEFVARMKMPMERLSDEALELTEAMGLPTFAFGGGRLMRRMAMVCAGGRVERVFYPVFPPDRNAAEVLGYLRARDRAGG